MCIAVPSKVIEIKAESAIIDVEGIRREVSLALTDDIAMGDYVIVHAGFIIHKMDETEALESINLLKEVLSRIEASDLSSDRSKD